MMMMMMMLLLLMMMLGMVDVCVDVCRFMRHRSKRRVLDGVEGGGGHEVLEFCVFRVFGCACVGLVCSYWGVGLCFVFCMG